MRDMHEPVHVALAVDRCCYTTVLPPGTAYLAILTAALRRVVIAADCFVTA
jgi:hypothetical protein